MNITPSQKSSIVKKLFSTPVLNALKLQKVTKDELLHQFSNNRTTHIGELTFTEAVELNSYLYAIMQQAPPDPRDAQRKKVIALCRAYGWEFWLTKNGDRRLVADMKRINGWVLANFKAPLNALSTEDLSRCIVAAENMERSHRNAVINNGKGGN